MKRTKLEFNKPVYVGMCILDLSKTVMYGGNAKLLFTDTDSLMYEIHTEDFYRDISGDVGRMFDTSGYNDNPPSRIPVGKNKKVLGIMKDEFFGEQVLEFVGLRATLYSCRTLKSDLKKCKGVITVDDYKNCLFDGKRQLRKMNTFRSRKHEIYTEEINKISLSREDETAHPT